MSNQLYPYKGNAIISKINDLANGLILTKVLHYFEVYLKNKIK